MDTKYSRTEFDGYTHRFIVRFSVDDDYRSDISINIYSNNGDTQDLIDFINIKRTDRVESYTIEHKATKEQDDMASEFINEWLKNN